MTIRALILDLGEVLVHAQPADTMAAMARCACAPADAFASAYWRHRRDYDLRGDGREYWRRVLKQCGGIPADAVIDALIEQDAASWTHYREPVWTIASEFRARGGLTAMLSNGVPEIMRKVRAERRLHQYFDAVVVSCEVGVAKPDQAIYELCLARLGAAAGSTLFVDDRIENIAGAVNLGIRTLHFTGEASVSLLRESVNKSGLT
jgi:putative hydrolase of the HAD superfamily